MPDLFATLREERNAAEEAVINACLSVVITERLLATDEKAAGELQRLRDDLALAARDLTNAVDESPLNTWPKNWATTADGTRR